ncbi:predicted protein [Aspergillus nidulans FGSC A4]|uniref:Uncharacterized protein n=1 Tax=Emericella nidulans (strain FGSC A4 / ATCC 38163 / CBS 112.46 / NRRL 194 / M139) TaxID=227321 RepID=Q5BCB6_EMENI|nr:hypothetical protein [Aspergillus nidulans FGSC A4]EAA64979.1 predicted protein [Aspergillus nidulans FGSC A4]CBF85613.1 TPA: conserved hypothetical protein [Aspergillus nidulans FGSC A4]|eukprot:XP_659418.1 predicted protein [Aspergillus nidulans FGSC A4]
MPIFPHLGLPPTASDLPSLTIDHNSFAMSSAASPAGHSTANGAARPDAQAPLPVLSRSLLVEHQARGKEGILKDPCFYMINAVNERVSKDLEGYGFGHRDLDKVLVRFFRYVFESMNPDLEKAWKTYKKKSDSPEYADGPTQAQGK